MLTRRRLSAGLLTIAAVLTLSITGKRTQPIVRQGNPRFSEVDGVLLYDAMPFSGTIIDLFPDGSVSLQAHFEQGRKDGETREFANNGALRARWNYRAGKKNGLQQGWFIEGPMRFEQHYKSGILDGVQTDWHLNGTIFNQQTFVDGVEAARKVLHPTGEVYSNYIKKDKRTYGIDGGALCFEVKREGER